MSFLTQRLLAKRQGNVNANPYNRPPVTNNYHGQIPQYIPPIANYNYLPAEHIEQPGIKVKLMQKKKYEIGETKPDIIENIIESKPSVNQVRKAMQEYIKMTENERDNL